MMVVVEKTATGIKGFDKLVQGGLLRGKTILLSGTPGTGKTIFALQYLYNGATMFNEPGVYITFEERVDALKSQARQFGWDFDRLEKEKKVRLLNIPVTTLNKNTVSSIIEIAKEFNAKRLVIDSLSTLSINTPSVLANVADRGELAVKKFIYSFIDSLRQLDSTTTLLISQNASEGSFSNDSVSEFISDGVIHFIYESMGGEFSRSIVIRKMREIKNDDDLHPVEISKKGIVVHDLK
jgi:KaiC/GvpD/RAD55 family RecA-like ATPase